MIDPGLSAGVLVTTHETFATVVSRKHLTLDNVQASFQSGCSFPLVSLYNSVARNQAPRLVTISPLELRIRNMLEEFWIIDEFGDLIAEIPDPTQMPLCFLDILSELEILCVDRVAFFFMIRIVKLKTWEKLPQSYRNLAKL